MSHVDLCFTVKGSLPLDHGYALYGALSRAVPALHGNGACGVHRIGGERAKEGHLELTAKSRLRLRVPEREVAHYIGLSGERLEVAGHVVEVLFPRVEALAPAANLAARIVTFKGAAPREREGGAGGKEHGPTPEEFLATCRAHLEAMEIKGEPALVAAAREPWIGKPLRRVLDVKGRKIVGYAMQVAGLTAEESIRLQEEGLGGRRRMGCGLFMPLH
jgi:CRISPR-associated protein Cas6